MLIGRYPFNYPKGSNNKKDQGSARSVQFSFFVPLRSVAFPCSFRFVPLRSPFCFHSIIGTVIPEDVFYKIKSALVMLRDVLMHSDRLSGVCKAVRLLRDS